MNTSEMKKMLRATIRLLSYVIFLGTIMMWILTPTAIHRYQWLPKIQAKADSTYFGTQGSVLLVYTFPLLFLAVLGCAYLHLGKKLAVTDVCSVGRPDKKNGLSLWRRPALVKGALGVVSRTELAFFVMFVALLIWSFAVYLKTGFSFGMYSDEEEVWKTKLQRSVFRLGLVGNTCLAFLFFPITRGLAILPLFGLTSESSIKYHIWLGHITMILFTSHGLGYIIYCAITNQLSEMLLWNNVGASNIAGELALLAGLGMWATTFPRIRRKMFELFFYTYYLYIPFVVSFVFHVGLSISSLMLPGLYLFVIDRYLRFLQSRRNVRLLFC